MKTNEVLENIKARRSVRAYTGQKVLEEDLHRVECIWKHGILRLFKIWIS